MVHHLSTTPQSLFEQLERQFLKPKMDRKPVHYFCGNSLGLQPIMARHYVSEVLNDWSELAVDGHFYASNRWYDYHKKLIPGLARLAGANVKEVTAMGTLTGNLHLLMVSFYQPKGKRTKVLMEASAFPSDQYLVESQVRFHGLNPNDHIIEVKPREGERTIRHEDIIESINKHGEEIAVVLFSGVQYLTGQAFELDQIANAAHSVGAYIGFDLAHAMGNINLKLNQWNVDFAAWCNYKYLNAGPGSIAGLFVHEKHANRSDLPRFAGWWGYDEETRFLMEKGFKPMEGAQGWQLSNENVMSMASLRSSLELFDQVPMDWLFDQRKELNFHLEDVLSKFKELEIITPKKRGAQLSISVKNGKGKALFQHLHGQRILGDWREPDVIRLSAVPMYNTHNEIDEVERALRSFFQTKPVPNLNLA
jgi:kynureninase